MKIVCNTTDCLYGFETVVNPQAGELSGGYKAFVEAFSFIIFAMGVSLNTGILTVMIATYPNLDSFDGLLMNFTFGELLSSFGLAFVFFVEFTTSMAPIGDGGCRFLTWLDLVSVTITITTLISIAYDLHNRIYHANSRSMSRSKLFGCIFITWLLASIPGLPYMATAKMVGRFCRISSWSRDAEILYICAMIFFQIVIPVAMMMFFLVRMLLALRVSLVGGSILNEESLNPGSESSFQRSVLKRKFRLLAILAFTFFLIIIIYSFIQLALSLNISQIETNFVKYRRIREGNTLLLCMKCVLMPMICLCFYDKLSDRIKRCFKARRNQEVYNSLRYNVYQQTVSEGVTSSEATVNGNGELATTENRRSEDGDALENANDDLYETERDDVAILDH